MKFSSKENLEVGSITGHKSDHLFFRCFSSLDGITSTEKTIIVEYKKNKFIINHIIDEECSAIKMLQNNELWCLGTYGNLYILKDGRWINKMIEIKPYYYLNNLWEIDDQIYSAGNNRRVLKLIDFEWHTLLPASKNEEITIFCIDSSLKGTVYCVGQEGFIGRFANNKFTRIEAPTNYDINHICVENENKIIICGEKGTFFVCLHDRWTDYSQSELDVNFYNMEYCKNKLFISAEKQVLYFEKNRINKSADINSFSLWKTGNKLWSLGIKEIHCFDGKYWKEFIVEIDIEEKLL